VLGRGTTPPSDRVALALIGCGGRGTFEGLLYTKSDTCQFVALCDVREDHRIRAKETFEKAYGDRKSSGSYKGIRLYNDFRDVLRQKDIDAVYIATPDHWHVPITIAAAKAGKDMHTEKPLGVSIEQDLATRKAVRSHHRIFQYGTESRSTPKARHCIELVLNGRIGKVQEIYVHCPPSLSGGSPTPVLPVPKGFDYDMWLGPAPVAPFCNDRCLVETVRNGHFYIYDYSLGLMANWGPHPLDLVQWWADHAGLTVPVIYEGTGTIASGGLFNTVTNWEMRCRYENGLVMHFMDYPTSQKYPNIPGIRNQSNAATFVGSEGWVSVSYFGAATNPASLMESEIGPNEIHLQQSDSHQLSWVESVKTRKDPVSPIESAVHSNVIPHLSDICIRTGRPIRWDPVKETIVGDEGARKMMSRPMRKPWGVS
jgi:predicted dehydrogenase